jgi:hypothetical protein
MEFEFDAVLAAVCYCCGAISGFMDLSDAEKWRAFSLWSIVLVLNTVFSCFDYRRVVFEAHGNGGIISCGSR